MRQTLAAIVSVLALVSTGAAQRPGWRLPDDKFVEIYKHRIHYYDKGSGPVLLLVHGFSGSAVREWGRVFDLLAENHRVGALNQIGFAPSEQPKILYSTDAFVDHLGQFIRALNLRQSVLVESFGGWVVASYAVSMSRRGSTLPAIGKIAIVAGAIGLNSMPPPTARNFFDPLAQAEMREATKQYPHLDNDRTVSLALEQSGLAKGEPRQADLARIRVPTLLIWGDKDELVPVTIGDKLAQTIRGARLSVLPNVGHIVAVESPLEFARIVSAFAFEK